MFIPDRVLHGRPMTTNNAKSRFIRNKAFDQSTARNGRSESAGNAMGESVLFEQVSNGVYQVDDNGEGMQAKYETPGRPNLNIPLHQMGLAVDSYKPGSNVEVQQEDEDPYLDIEKQKIDIEQYQQNQIQSPITQPLQAEEVPDVDLTS